MFVCQKNWQIKIICISVTNAASCISITEILGGQRNFCLCTFRQSDDLIFTFFKERGVSTDKENNASLWKS